MKLILFLKVLELRKREVKIVGEPFWEIRD